MVTNVELDHHATYASEADVRAAFGAFLERVPAGGTVVVWERAGVAPPPGARVVTFGLGAGAEMRGERCRAGPGRGRVSSCAGPGTPWPRRAPGARRAQRAERARGARRGGGGGLPARRPPRRWRASGPPAAGSRRAAKAAGCASSTTTRTTRPRSRRRCRRRARSRPAPDRGLPAASLLAHAAHAPRVRPRAGAGRRGGRARRLPGARAPRGRARRRDRQAGRRRGRRQRGRPPGLVAADPGGGAGRAGRGCSSRRPGGDARRRRRRRPRRELSSRSSQA